MTSVFNYIERKSPIHSLTGATKLLCLLLWSFAAMLTFDTRLLLALSVLSLVLFSVSRIKYREISFVFSFMLVFLALNAVAIFIFGPEHGVSIYGTRHVICPIFGGYALTWEQLFYQLNVVLKFFATIPIVLLFICTTNPSEFASSLSRIGVSYKAAYSVSLAMRYIPDIQSEFRDITLSQQARGIEMSKKEKLIKRLVTSVKVMFPLVISSMDRIEVISNAMELRRFGKGKKRTWYTASPYTKWDALCIALCALLLAGALLLNILTGSRYYNPFI